jgi:hypothetical protein
LAHALPALTAAGLGGSSDIVVLPALDASFDNLLRTAARSQTLVEFVSVRAVAATAEVEAAQLMGLERRLWAGSTAPLRHDYLASIDVPGLDWRAQIVSDWTAVQQEIGSADEIQALEMRQQTRLTVRDSLSRFLAWPQAAVFDVRVGEQSMLAMLRLRGLLQHDVRSTHEAWTMALGGGLKLAGIVPAGTLADFARSGLASSLAEAAVSVPSIEAEWELPLLDLSSAPPAPGLTLAYDRLRADLSGMDSGGSYLRSARSPQALRLSRDGISFSGHQLLAFNFESANVNAPQAPSSGSGGAVISGGSPQWCPETVRAPRPMFLAVLDEAHGLLALAAVERPARLARQCMAPVVIRGPGS